MKDHAILRQDNQSLIKFQGASPPIEVKFSDSFCFVQPFHIVPYFILFSGTECVFREKRKKELNFYHFDNICKRKIIAQDSQNRIFHEILVQHHSKAM